MTGHILQLEKAEAKGRAFVAHHFSCINAGLLEEVRAHFPPAAQKPAMDRYLEEMRALAPVEIVSITTRMTIPARERPLGTFATFVFDVSLECSRGVLRSDVNVWWYPETARYMLGTRTAWWRLADGPS